MHIEATYPDEEENLNVWTSESKMVNIIKRYNELNFKFKQLRLSGKNVN